MKGDLVEYATWCYIFERGHALTPDEYKVAESELKSWKHFLAEKLYRQRGIHCEKCGEDRKLSDRGGIQVHEGIVKKNEISMSVPRWWEIFAEMNSFLLCQVCHGEGLPRSEFYQKAVNRYGKKAVDDWLESLPFKHTYKEGNDV